MENELEELPLSAVVENIRARQALELFHSGSDANWTFYFPGIVEFCRMQLNSKLAWKKKNKAEIDK